MKGGFVSKCAKSESFHSFSRRELDRNCVCNSKLLMMLISNVPVIFSLLKRERRNNKPENK